MDAETKRDMQSELEKCVDRRAIKEKGISPSSYVANETYFEVSVH
jgi:hypothetical protein